MARRVLHAACSETFAGVQRVIVTVCSHLDRSRYEPVVATPDVAPLREALAQAGVAHHVVPLRGMTDWQSALVLRRLMRQESIDLLHVHLGITTVLGRLATMGTGVPMVVSRHFIHENYTRWPGPARTVGRGVYGWLNRGAAAVVGVSQAVADGVAAREAGLAGKLHVIHNAIPAPGPVPEKPPAPPLRLVCLSRLDPEKGLGIFLEALRLLKEQGVAFHADLLGKGQQEEHLRMLAERWGLGGVLTIHGFVADPNEFLRSAHVLIHAAQEEPFGLALLEAMGQGLAVVAVNAGGPREIVQPDLTGQLVPPGNAPALAEVLARWARDPSGVQAMGQGGYQRVCTAFSASQQARRHMDLYDSILG